MHKLFFCRTKVDRSFNLRLSNRSSCRLKSCCHRASLRVRRYRLFNARIRTNKSFTRFSVLILGATLPIILCLQVSLRLKLLMSTINLCYAVLPTMQEQRWGRIVAITSVAARQPEGHLILSNTARAGALGFLKSLSTQVAAAGITVNAVCPGYTQTERITELAEAFEATGQGTAADFYHRIEAGVPMRRMGTPEEFADTVAYLASSCASYITGVALPIDGGYIKSLF